MDVSVVVPTRNRSHLLATTLRSALGQRGVALEVIVVDEASTDDTSAVVSGLADSRLRVIRHETPQGVSVARNRGLAEAHADWVAFLDDDDLWAPDKLVSQLEAVREQGVPWVYVGHVNINNSYRVTGGARPLPPAALLSELPRHNVVPGGCSGVMASKRALAAAGGFDPQLQPLADWDLWLRLARVGQPGWVPRPLVAYRLHGQQMSLDTRRVETEFWRLAQHNPAADPAILYRYLGWWALRVHDHRQALRLFSRACWQRPSETMLNIAGFSALVRGALQRRFGIRLPSPSGGPSTAAEPDWGAQGQKWVDALVGPNRPIDDTSGSSSVG
jgi:glycosyltransferase involved in cell wall biosynthesis